MPFNVIGTTLDLGYPGNLSRTSDAVIINRISTGEVPFGAPVKLNEDNTVSVFTSSDTADKFLGIAVRNVKQQTTIETYSSKYLDKQPTDVLTRGSMIVALADGTPTAGGTVYVAASGAPDTGYFSAASGTQLTNTKFTTGHIDGTGVAEVTILSRFSPAA